MANDSGGPGALPDPSQTKQPTVMEDSTTSALSSSMTRLSIDTHDQHHPKPYSSPTAQNRRPSPMSPSRAPSSASLSRRSSSIALDRQPGSPKLKHKSSASALTRIHSQGSSPRPQIRRTLSSNTLSNSPKSAHSQHEPFPEPKPRPTAASIASDHFKKELALHEAATHDTTIFIHDSCYAHRWSRPKTPKSTLALIVERPERLRAGMLGISSAYVRHGGRHAGAANPVLPNQAPPHDLPFRIQRSTRQYPLTTSAVTNVHGVKWMQELKMMCDLAEGKLANGEKELSRPDTPTNSTKPMLHEGDLYLCKDSLEALQGALGGVLDATDAVFGGQTKQAFVCIRPPGHHCSADMPSGFCWLNNVHVGIEHAAQTYGLTHAAIIDFDLHHGDGSQTITWERNAKAAKAAKNAALAKKTSIGYFSLHDINSYPCEWGDTAKVQAASLCIENAHNQTIWNVHLQPWKTEEEFWNLYESRYLVLLEKARVYLKQQTQRFSSLPGVRPKSAIFLSAGFDASEWESEGMQRHKVNVPTTFYARFTRDVRKLAEEEGTSVDGRIISVLEGGYSDRALTSGILSHVSGLIGDTNTAIESSWWSLAVLKELETLHAPPPPVAPKRTARSAEVPTYQTPTQSFSAKAVDPTKLYRTTSGTLQTPPRSPTPPPPEVNWCTAAHELSKLLVPSDRSTVSCRYEELNQPRAPKPERHSTIGIPSAETSVQHPRMQLRDRKAKTPAYNETSAADSAPIKIEKSNRRRTTGDATTLTKPDEVMDDVRPSVESESTVQSGHARAGSSAAAAAPTSRSPSKSRSTQPKQPPSRASSRRVSNGGAELQAQVNNDAPPMPSVPEHFANKDTVPQKSDAVDQLVSGVRKIKLNLSKPTKAAEGPSKPAKKPSAAKATKPSPEHGNPIKLNTKAGSGPGKSIPTEAAAVKVPSTQTEQFRASNGGHAPLASTTKKSPTSETMSSQTSVQTEAHGKLATARSDQSKAPLVQVPPGQVNGSTATAAKSPDQGQTLVQAPQANEFIPYIPPNQSQTEAVKLEQQELQWLPPNTSTPVQTPIKPNRNDLPTFSPVGHIPFAPMPASAPTTHLQPNTTQAINKPHTLETQSISLNGETPNSDPVKGLTTGPPTGSAPSEIVWTVPKTPERK